MNLDSAIELREAAVRARALCLGQSDPEVRRGFSDLATKWDAEALALEQAEE